MRNVVAVVRLFSPLIEINSELVFGDGIAVELPRSAAKPSTDERSVTFGGPVVDRSQINPNAFGVTEKPGFGVNTNCI